METHKPNQRILSLLPYGLPAEIYRSPMPFSRMFDLQGEVFSAYQKAGISCVVMLVSDEEAIQQSGYDLRRLYEDAGMQVIACAVEDFSTPPRGAFDEALKLVTENAGRGIKTVIHCHAGIGRTGMFAACLARLVFGMDVSEAVAWVRKVIPQAVETSEQQRFVEDFIVSGD